jgi:hypothetical protein
MQSDQLQELRSAVRGILMTKWDPIGVSDVPEAADEYDSYIDGVCNLLKHGAIDNEIAGYLLRIETERMGLSDLDGKPLLPTEIREAAVTDLQRLRPLFSVRSPRLTTCGWVLAVVALFPIALIAGVCLVAPVDWFTRLIVIAVLCGISALATMVRHGASAKANRRAFSSVPG